MNHIAPRAEPLIREVPLSRLALAPENVRKTPPDPQADAELKASIAALGLLENLVVRTAAPDPGSLPGQAADGAECYAVVAGGRRLMAMQSLVEDGVLDADHPVPCLVAADGNTVGELSLAENVVRIAMHPADQVVAFTNLAGAGLSVATIAARFGMSERLVEQRLRLGNAAPELLEAYRANAIDLEVLKAFAVTTDRERQMAVWEQVSAQGYRPSAWQVKRLLTEERVPGASAIARFVGVEAYEAAGGQVLRDLFARDDESGVWFECCSACVFNADRRSNPLALLGSKGSRFHAEQQVANSTIGSTVILQAHHRSDGLADALGRGLDFPVPEMGVAQRHAHIAVAEQSGYHRHRYPVHHRVARQRMAQVVKADILDPCFLADPIP